ncbi:ATP-binding cassette domain-containing protein [Thermogladius sp. 4427co]|uniref:ATP-binding cassette domain-containing protein n=1 Tax=Thermogladius sp. 4427co TaxID=3450718 RepID=UPI003F78B77B
MSILVVDNIRAEAGGNIVVQDARLEIGVGDVVFLLGPNGSGKTSLIRTIIGYPGYRVLSGRVLFENEDLTDKPMEYRVEKGLGVAHQFPPKLTGLRVSTLLESICRRKGCSVSEIAEATNISNLLEREFGKSFSGGELKRVELATLLALKPKVSLIDEPDSGVDVDSIKIIGDVIKRLIDSSPYKAALIVTHTAMIAKYVQPTKICLMLNKRIEYCGGPELLGEVFEHGFKTVARRD